MIGTAIFAQQSLPTIRKKSSTFNATECFSGPVLNHSADLAQRQPLIKILRIGGYDAHLCKLRRELKKQIHHLRQAMLRYFPAGT